MSEMSKKIDNNFPLFFQTRCKSKQDKIWWQNYIFIVFFAGKNYVKTIFLDNFIWLYKSQKRDPCISYLVSLDRWSFDRSYKAGALVCSILCTYICSIERSPVWTTEISTTSSQTESSRTRAALLSIWVKRVSAFLPSLRMRLL